MMNNEQKTVVTLANGVEFSFRVVEEIAGNEISDKIDNGTIGQLARNKIAAKLAKKMAAYQGGKA